MNLFGDNFVKLEGKITRKQVNTYDNGSTLFKCSLAVPAPTSQEKYQYINVSVWGEKAESLSEVGEGTVIRVFGHLEKHSYKTNCKYCNGASTTYWVEVVIDNFIVLGA